MITTNRMPADDMTITLAIDGMNCRHCVNAVTKALVGVPGVEVRSVAIGNAQITAPDRLTVDRAVAALDDAGYSARASEAQAGVAANGALRGGKQPTLTRIDQS
jgi:copper chaperone CopZ